LSVYRALVIDGGLAVPSWAASGTLRPFVKRLLERRATYAPLLTVVCWGAPRHTTWRRARSPEYKAGRPPPDAKLAQTLAELRADLPALDIAQASAEGAEADDVLYALSRTLPGPVLLCSADKDLLQAVSPGVDLLRPGRTYQQPDVLVTLADIERHSIKAGKRTISGLTPEGWRDWLTLAGDHVDGIPGLPGVGGVHARDILAACPAFVDLVLSGREDQARREVEARNGTLTKWVEVAIRERDALELSRELVSLRMVDVQMVDAEPDEERARAVLEGAGLAA
jgi:DNA polymerase-1